MGRVSLPPACGNCCGLSVRYGTVWSGWGTVRIDKGVPVTGTDEAVDRPLMEVVFDAIDADKELADDAKYLVLAALEGADQLNDQLDGVTLIQTRRAAQALVEEPVGAFLTSVEVAGFRGIGPKSELKLHPAPGITIVSGRNGSGKSSFAEALEFAVTGKSYRWENKAKLWKDTWRNLHESSQCHVRVGLTIEGSEPTVVGVDWAADASLTDNSTWTQVGKAKRSPGTDGLGWKSAIELHRPILSYDEIGGLIEDSPSTLYDALAKLLGLDEIADAEKCLASALKDAKVPRQAAKDELAQLKRIVGESTDDRAQSAVTLLKKRNPDINAVQALATGSASTQSAALSGLRAIVGLAIALQEQVDAVVAALRKALAGTVDLASDALAIVERRNALLTSALELHADTGTTDCPVCETGTLDDAWAEHARTRMSDEDNKLTRFKEARRNFEDARRAATALIDDLADATAVDGVDLPSLNSYREAVIKARAAPGPVTELAEHLTATLPAVVESGGTLRHEAAAAIQVREDTWAPIASRLASWVQMEQTAAKTDATVTSLEAAKKWMTAHAIDLRNQRLEPIAEQAREIWAELRQESNVDIGAISLQGTNTSRKAVLKGTVDGVPSEALSVMSQGELHALALALFIPRATTPNSPFRFIVLDQNRRVHQGFVDSGRNTPGRRLLARRPPRHRYPTTGCRCAVGRGHEGDRVEDPCQGNPQSGEAVCRRCLCTGEGRGCAQRRQASSSTGSVPARDRIRSAAGVLRQRAPLGEGAAGHRTALGGSKKDDKQTEVGDPRRSGRQLGRVAELSNRTRPDAQARQRRHPR
jgi:hypothetical protein